MTFMYVKMKSILLILLTAVLSIKSAAQVDIYQNFSDSITNLHDTLKAAEYIKRGLVLSKRDKLESGYGQAAVTFFVWANELRPNYYWEAYYWLVRLDYVYGKEAMDMIQTAIKLKPEDSELYSFRSHLKDLSGDSIGALQDITWAIIFSPNNPGYYLSRAQFLDYNWGLYKQALNDCNRAIELDSTYAYAYYQKGQIYYWQKDIEKACENFHKAIEHNINQWEIAMKDCGIDRPPSAYER